MKNWIYNFGKGIILTLFALVVWPAIALIVTVYCIFAKKLTIGWSLVEFVGSLRVSTYILFHSIDDGFSLLNDVANGDVTSFLRKIWP